MGTIHSLERITEREPGPAVRRYERPGVPAWLWLLPLAGLLIGFGLGVVHGRVNPAREVPVGGVEAEFEDYLRREGP